MRGIGQEKKMVSTMIGLYCRGRHKPRGPGLCRACQGLEAYAHQRLDKCPYGDDKDFCSSCPSPCYRPVEKAMIRRVMAYAGPRMIGRHPLMALSHLKASCLKGMK